MTRRYFDHAATSYPKPPGVAEAIAHQLLNVGASAGRGSYREAVEAGALLDRLRARLRRLFHAAPDDSVVFTHNGTDALNMALKGFVPDGSHVVTTAMDHNSVLRPLSAMRQRRGVEWSVVPADPLTTRVDPESVAAAITPRTCLVAVTHASNVTGALQPVVEIARVCRDAGVPLLVDAAQTAGHVPIDLREMPIDLLAMPGHKGLMGPTGTGVLVLREPIAARMRSVREGGTGSSSERPAQPDHLPDLLESGSHNAIGLAGLDAAVAWIQRHGEGDAAAGVNRLQAHEQRLAARLLDGLSRLPGLRLYGPRDDRRVGVFSVRIDGLEPAELSAILETSFGILTRSGLHCAPLAHETIRTAGLGGTTRLSLGAFHTESDVDAVVDSFRVILRTA